MDAKIPIKLAVVEPRGDGGMIHYAYQLCNALSHYVTDISLITTKKYEMDKYPHEFQVVHLLSLWSHTEQPTRAQIKNILAQIGWKIFRNIRRMGRGIRLFFEWIKLTAMLVKRRPDIIQFGSIEFPFEAIFLQFLKSKGLILAQICHEFEPRERRKNLLTRINNALLKNVFSAFTVLFFHSQANLERFHELYPEIPRQRCHIIAMGNGQLFTAQADKAGARNRLLTKYGIKEDNPVVLFFGNITPSKGVPDLLEAFKEVHLQNPQSRLVIAGKPLKYINMNSLTEATSRLGIDEATCFDTRYIPIEEVEALMGIATVAAFPYTSATQSASIQTAYACGKPVIATRVGGLPDLVMEGKSGLLVDPGSPGQLAKAILEIINHADAAKAMGRKAKELSETRFSWEPIAAEIANIYGLIARKINTI